MIASTRLQHFSSGGLALAIHAAFLAALMLSLTWKTLPHAPVEAELWAALPEPAPLVLEEIPLPEPDVAPLPPEVPVIAKTDDADIALKKAEQEAKLEEKKKQKLLEEERLKQERLEQQRQQQIEQEKEKAKEQAKEQEKRRAEENAKLLVQQEQRRKQLELENAQAMERQRLAELAEEESRIRAQQVMQLQALRRERVVDEFKLKIQTKIQGLVRLPPNISGNPEATFQVTLFPNGEVRKVTLLKSSGSPAYDVEVERAILKASPLPLPTDKDAAQPFRAGLNLNFRPFQKGQF
jgi:colicin import membrane protein